MNIHKESIFLWYNLYIEVYKEEYEKQDFHAYEYFVKIALSII